MAYYLFRVRPWAALCAFRDTTEGNRHGAGEMQMGGGGDAFDYRWPSHCLDSERRDRSAEWYCSLLNMQVALKGDSEDVKFRVLAHPDSGWVLGVRQYPSHHADGFNEYRTGLDHFAFGVATRAELEQWQKELSSRGITFTPIAETPIGWVIVFRDPVNIQLEFWLPAA